MLNGRSRFVAAVSASAVLADNPHIRPKTGEDRENLKPHARERIHGPFERVVLATTRGAGEAIQNERHDDSDRQYRERMDAARGQHASVVRLSGHIARESRGLQLDPQLYAAEGVHVDGESRDHRREVDYWP